MMARPGSCSSGRRPSGWRILSLMLASLLASCLYQAKAAAKDHPEIASTKFDSLPKTLFYFEGSQTILFHDRDMKIVWRSTDGGAEWKKIGDVTQDEALFMWQHPFDNDRAYLLSGGTTHYQTDDQGKNWKEFETPVLFSRFSEPLAFHAEDNGKIILNGMECSDILLCSEKSFYTLDGFKTKPKELRDETRGCSWAKSTPIFTSGDKDADENRIVCVAAGRYSKWKKDNRLLVSDDYFKSENEPLMNDGRAVPGILNVVSAKKYIVAAAKAAGSAEMALYVSTDGKDFKHAIFPHDHKLEEKAYTILESTNYSIQVDVMTAGQAKPMGVLFSSNSDGVKYTRLLENTHRSRHGYVDFEKIQGIQGIVLVNIVDNHKEIEGNPQLDEVIKSQISFDDGRTFFDIRAGKEDTLHLHSVTDLANSGRIFSSPAPGLVMGVGNTGKKLLPYDEGDLYVSDDAGETWSKALEGAHKYEFGDQGSVLVAVYDEAPTDQLMYSIDHGKKWKKVDLGHKVKARLLTTSPDSSSLKFLLVGSTGSGSKTEHWTFSIDFSGLHERTCSDKDFEDWCARRDQEGECDCLMGHKQYFRRRKADADCFIKKKMDDPSMNVKTEQCDCADEDFECDIGFFKENNKCVPGEESIKPPGACKKFDEKFEASSGYRLIPGNDCKRGKGSQKDDPTEHDCDEVKKPASGEITAEVTTFDANMIFEKHYLERPADSMDDDETVIIQTDAQEIFVTHDHGKTWDQILKGKNIVRIYPHSFNHDRVYFITPSHTVHYSTDRARDKFDHFKAPHSPATHEVNIMNFHEENHDWIIWMGDKDCSSSKGNCHAVAELSTNRGADWRLLQRYVKKCQFVYHEIFRSESQKLVFCEKYQDEDPEKPVQLVTSNDWFDTVDVKFPDIRDFATMSEFIVVAAEDREKSSLKVDCSVNGDTFADAQFPRNFQVDVQKAYTVLDSSTHSIFLHVTTNTLRDHEYGSIIKSNSNGTSYALSVNYVNRNRDGYVDFEKTLGMEGVAVVNVVANHEEAAKGELKKLKTKMTHNDGADWSLVRPPAKKSDGTDLGCSGGDIEKCSLHLHGYTERDDPTDTYSSASAVGVMLGVGNVGEFLDRPDTGDTFMSTDGGVNWKHVIDGNFMWEFGDQGSVIVLVAKETPTTVIYYTTDQGINWIKWSFSSEEMEVNDITTVPSDTSMNFLLWGKKVGRGGNIMTVNLDFSGMFDDKCELIEKDPEAGDYDLWTPEHPDSGKCLFGHVAKYHRKKAGKMCYNGRNRLNAHIHDMSESCPCERRDFECDYDYERRPDGSCVLVEGATNPTHIEMCAANASLVEYFESTGYRRIPLDTCEGGKEMELTGKSFPCPNHEQEFAKKHSLGGFALFCIIVIPIAIAAGAGYWVWRNWDGKFGQIRLGDNPGSETWEGITKVVVVVVAGVWTVIAMVPDVVGRLWSWARGGRRYTSRSSFQRARGEYEAVTRLEEEDVGGLLGDESDDEA